MSEPYIQREATGSRGLSIKGNSDGSKGTALKAAPTQRQLVQQKAVALGIETKGLSTREVKTAVKEKEDAQKELGDFIKGVVADLPKNTPNLKNEGGPETSNRGSEDVPSNIPPLNLNKGNNPQRSPLRIDFYCWQDGVAGTIPISALGFSPLQP